MAYLVLARKYRPQTFEEVIGQDHVTQTLGHAIEAGRVAHAILFAGPRGTGKTTVARILAKALNCAEGPAPVPCNACRACLEITAGNCVDVFEIDGASNNSVDQIRDLRENSKYMPAHSRHKIYIIDEVHMLSLSAFNALLKTLEEPPAHVLFFFATTEPHKIPITILSRCQRHDLRRINLDTIAAHLADLSTREGMAMAPDSLQTIAREAGGSMRDALSLLDQILAVFDTQMDHERLLDLLGVVDRRVLFELSEAVLAQNIVKVLEIIAMLYDRGQDFKRFYTDLTLHFRNLLLVRLGAATARSVDVPAHERELMQTQTQHVSPAFLHQILDAVFREESVVKMSVQPRIALEMLFVRLFQLKPALLIDELLARLENVANLVPSASRQTVENQTSYVPAPGSPKPAASVDVPIRSDTSPPPPMPDALPASPQTPRDYDNASDLWSAVLAQVKQQAPALASSLVGSHPLSLTADQLTIALEGNPFTLESARRQQNIIKVQQTIQAVSGRTLKFAITSTETPAAPAPEPASSNHAPSGRPMQHPLVVAAMNVFSGEIVDVKYSA